MSATLQINCWVLGDSVKKIFRIKIERTEAVSVLKDAIKDNRRPEFDEHSAVDLVIWKVTVPLEHNWQHSPEIQHLAEGDDLSDEQDLTDVFPDGVLKKHLHIVVKRMNPSPGWLLDMHRALWGRRHLFGDIFRVADLTAKDFFELQNELHNSDQFRSDDSYQAKNVLEIKAKFLRLRSRGLAASDVTTQDGRLPQLRVDNSKGNAISDNSDASDDDEASDGTDDSDDADNDTLDAVVLMDAMDINAHVNPDPSSRAYIDVDVASLSEGSNAIFPCTIQYMDLTFLRLKGLLRCEHLMLIRDEWRTMVGIFNDRELGIHGSAIFTGQPGIGKTCLLYYTLILCFLLSQPVVFQDVHGRVFFIGEEVCPQRGDIRAQGNNVLALVDADQNHCCTPHALLLNSDVQILLTSSPKGKQDQTWLTQHVHDQLAVFMMKPWSLSELYVTAFFITRSDITFRRLQAAIHVCGYVPRACFGAARSPDSLDNMESELRNAIKDTPILSQIKKEQKRSVKLSHPVYEIFPSLPSRSLSKSHARPVSEVAKHEIRAQLLTCSAKERYEYYMTMRSSSPSFAGTIFEDGVHKYLKSISMPTVFTLRSLADNTESQIKFSPNIMFETFSSMRMFTTLLTNAVKEKRSCYLQPDIPNNASFDSYLYLHDIGKCGRLFFVQMTGGGSHLIAIAGCQAAQAALTQQTVLADFRPSRNNKWSIIFILPKDTAAPFRLQRFRTPDRTDKKTNMTKTWVSKTTQYVLEVPVDQVMGYS